MKPKKIFFYTEYFYPVRNSTGYFLTEIIKAQLRFSGKLVEVFCATKLNHAPELEVPSLKVTRIAKLFDKKDNLITRVADFIFMTFCFCGSALWRVRKGDSIFTVTNPAFMIIFFALYRKICDYKFILLAYDIFPENIIAAGLGRKNSLQYAVAKRIFDWSYRQADIVISIGRDMSETLKAKGVSSDRIHCIPNWADPEAIQPQERENNRYIRQFHLSKSVVFLFAGNLGRVQGIENLLTAIERQKETNAAFLFIGDGAALPFVKAFQKKYPEKRVYATGALPMALQNDFLNAGDVALISLGNHMRGLGVPSKSYFNMAAGKPLLYIGDHDTEIACVVQEEKLGWVIPPDDPQALAQCMDAICMLPRDVLLELGKNARAVAENRFAKELILQRYLALLNESEF